MNSTGTTARAAGATRATVAAVRDFNRFYTRLIGVLDERQGAPAAARLTLTQVRLLYELAQRPGLTASVLAEELALDPGYLSRLLRGFERQRWIRRVPAAHDGRAKPLRLTAAGHRAFKPYFDAAESHVSALVAPLGAHDQARLLAAMTTVRQLLGRAATADGRATAGMASSASAALSAPSELSAADGLTLRPHRPGDIGWVIERHGARYHAEYGFDGEFEALVAEIGAKFLRRFDPASERGWIVERACGEGSVERVGCAFIVRQSATTAKLRLVLVEPSVRGLGIGRRLVAAAIAFATERGYRKLTLWTNDCLHAARAIYVAHGFRLVREQAHHSFGHDLVGQYWSLPLRPLSPARSAGRSATAAAAA
ncbi:MAG: GNAT family N-acetyltransferase [Lautropia sp.]